MITKEELTHLLTISYEELRIHPGIFEISPKGLEDIVVRIINVCEKRPMPDYSALFGSLKARMALNDIILDYSGELEQNAKKIDDDENHLRHIELNFNRITVNENEFFVEELNEIITSLSRLKKIGYLQNLALRTEFKLDKSKFLDGFKRQYGLEVYECYISAVRWLIVQVRRSLKEQKKCFPYVTLESINNLVRASLELHSQRYVLEESEPRGPVHIIHFYSSSNYPCEFGGILTRPHASEYLEGFDSENEEHLGISFDKTTHGLGSGVYGLGKLREDIIDCVISDGSNFEIFEISEPLRLIDVDTNDASEEFIECESDQLTRISKYLQLVGNDLLSNLIEEKRQRRLPSKLRVETGGSSRSILHRTEVVVAYFTNEENRCALNSYACTLNQFKNINSKRLSQENMFELLKKSIVEWFIDAKPSRADRLPMPINYVMQNLGFTGIISKKNDEFNRGLIALKTDPKDLTVDKVVVKMSPSPSADRGRTQSVSSICSELCVLDTDNSSPTNASLNNGQLRLSVARNALAPHLPATSHCSSAASALETVHAKSNLVVDTDRLGPVDISPFEDRRPADCSRDPELLRKEQAFCTGIDRTGPHEQVVGGRDLKWQKPQIGSLTGTVFSVFRGRGSHLAPRTNDCSSAATEINIDSSTSDSMSL